MRRTWIATIAITATLFGFARSASAQAWLSNRALGEGRGIRVGNFELHPGLGAEVGYDTNVFASPNSSMATRPLGAVRLRITPSFAVSTLGQQRTAGATPQTNFRFYVSSTYHRFVPLDGTVTEMDRVMNASNFGVNSGVRVELFPHRNWTFAVSDDFARIVQGSADYGVSLSQFNRIQNRAGLALQFNPNSGVLGFSLSYMNHLEFFERSDVSFYSYMANEITFANRWRFLPQTAFVFDASIIPTFYFNNGGAPLALSPSHPMRARFGLNGLFSERFGLLAMVGYQGTFYERGDNADTVIFTLEARYLIDQRSTFLGGVARDIQHALVGGFNIRNRLYVDYSHNFGGRFLLSIRSSGGIMEYGCLTDPGGACALPGGRISGGGVDPNSGRFTTYRIDGTLFGEYRPTDWFGVNLTTSLSTNLGDVNFQSGAMALPVTWLKFEAYLGLRLSI